MAARGKGTHSTRTKPFNELTPGSRRALKAREKVSRLKKDGTPDRRFKAGAVKDELIDLPEDQDELDKKVKQENFRAKKLENDRVEGITLYRSEVDQEIINLMQAFADGASHLSDKYKSYRPDATPDDMTAINKLEAEIIAQVRKVVFGS